MAKRRKTRKKLFRTICVCFVLLVALVVALKFWETGPFDSRYAERDVGEMRLDQPQMDVRLLTVNAYSRPGVKSEKIRNIVIHYTANPGTSALQNREYFEGLKDSKERKASSHFIVGIKGEIVQCVPTWEVAYASNNRNIDTVSIETCHLSEDGSYTKETYDSLVHLTAWLCEKFELTEQELIRHYDITGKVCPKYFVENEDAWEEFKLDVKKALEDTD